MPKELSETFVNSPHSNPLVALGAPRQGQCDAAWGTCPQLWHPEAVGRCARGWSWQYWVEQHAPPRLVSIGNLRMLLHLEIGFRRCSAVGMRSYGIRLNPVAGVVEEGSPAAQTWRAPRDDSPRPQGCICQDRRGFHAGSPLTGRRGGSSSSLGPSTDPRTPGFRLTASGARTGLPVGLGPPSLWWVVSRGKLTSDLPLLWSGSPAQIISTIGSWQTGAPPPTYPILSPPRGSGPGSSQMLDSFQLGSPQMPNPIQLGEGRLQRRGSPGRCREEADAPRPPTPQPACLPPSPPPLHPSRPRLSPPY